ncbi:WS/DGAT/MGAT family O-acyltransferase [Mycobacterium bourgelatii]|uniref:Diacylglycerol O-acyltransferase n=1 Tax=Mycobacterium bourgelatii TaxID=1273442 RepID=A0A7I9YL51_MYCBU|nr:wax ester/triacylglycerol synthase family O-acyltransferase [Mycobacterium bourgelatii]MCV6976052.1 wax ester/triacylglycerol synthase family O-acyltransferase [Mycobacterium bourgelatii]GFG89416.1 putative diacyglycerol O-acyltransferase tgs2 [Mycobacterium bourgelatii]
MELIAPTDAIFLLTESREHPTHVGGLQLFERPDGSGPGFVRETHEALTKMRSFHPTFRKRPAQILGAISNLGWIYDDEIEIDIEYHVRRWVLPSPGRLRDLFELTSVLHSSPLDRHRPLWEAHLIEGLKDGRFAMYTKIHHALIDGVSMRHLSERMMSTDPQDVELRAFWNLPSLPQSPRRSRWRAFTEIVKASATLGPSASSVARAALRQQQLTLPFAAPRTMFNVRIGGARRYAAQSYSLERVKRIKQAAQVTLNDVVLAMCGGALRYYLAEQNALPDTPLVAMVPVSLREKGEVTGAGNKVINVLCTLATDIDDAAKRLATISESVSRNRDVFAELPRQHAVALSLLTAPWAVAALPGFVSSAPPPFNIVISNVPGSIEPMYWGGAKLHSAYPLSIPLDGLALNITVSNTRELDFGLVACRRSVPRLERLLEHLEISLTDLERAVGVVSPDPFQQRKFAIT